ncbi:LuxR C-terminal-related transcriptional regulator [Sinosporangium siamense]|uniref:HTH luxR-type domain-containing protein n=1 Tax=Sinosporangium siamense TaxID=1367973 RepID=A0A919V2U1_9ACTN|nr:LuxR C-terminal-related transcriptional regulator [Sinosporangium siamense]GII90285.1 hypothetical protein Ssi02_05160 [Sinosporangium siamense]
MQPRRPGYLASDITPLIGRAADVTEGVRLLGETRLLTVMGPPGVGKSRVGAQIARLSGRRFPDGVWQIELSSVPAGSCPAPHIASALGLGEGSPGARDTEVGRVVSALRGQRALLLLDTCEHVVDGVALLAESLLRRAPRVRVLATSRRPLNVPGERLLAVPPLSLPDPEPPIRQGRAARAGDPGLSGMSAPAVQLFAERAAAADPGFALTPGVLPVVTAICRRLDGVPLAIELAAARLRSLSVQELLEWLAEPFEVLSGSRSMLSRHRDMRSAIEWSHALCDPERRDLWAALSALDAPFDLEAVESVWSPVAAGPAAGPLAGLVDESVVLREPGESGVLYRLPYLHAEFARRAGGALPHIVPSPRPGADVRVAASALTRSDLAVPAPEPAPEPPSADAAAAALSPRELQVAVLITKGMTNREIAVQLGIAKRTVDAHVRNILTKGSLASRTQVASWVAVQRQCVDV